MNKVEQIKSLLKLEPLPIEGGYFRETYRSEEKLSKDLLPERYKAERCFSTLIYYLLTPDTVSLMHRVLSDEIFHFYVGDPIEMLQLHPDGSGKIIKIGSDILAGMEPQAIVKRGVWQGAKLAPGGQFALLGTTVAPGFEYDDYEHGKRDELINLYPKFKDMIIDLTN